MVELVDCGVVERALVAAPVPEDVLIVATDDPEWSAKYLRDRRSLEGVPRFVLVDWVEKGRW